jgi:hypothetical protein
MCNDLGEGSRCCAAYSIVGAIFTVSQSARRKGGTTISQSAEIDIFGTAAGLEAIFWNVVGIEGWKGQTLIHCKRMK